ncbi:hypothetical protein [Photobacterium phosphoreum]|uniref:hypothetical protein n=1 Tax=Photobacterium phosphoreum TaxID=659 RepID=UPI0007F8CC7B|nr:hypothetical protein [Photobacterium phosphoreum]OBU37894.1 hypothetical protein AYY24_01205 [Photobacterium phosphoreum]PSW38961.1 hypothetical protein CTM87_01335 [Photobacterium phosphoreum]
MTGNIVKKVFKCSYDMPSTKEHTIDAELLGTTILSLAKAIKTSDKIINGKDASIQLNVKAHEEGSFVVEFVAWVNQSGFDILDILGITLGTPIVGGTVFGALEQIKENKIVAKVKKQNQQYQLELSDGSFIECTEQVANIVTDPHVRGDLAKVISNPICGNKDSKFIVKDEDDNPILNVDGESALNFKSIPNSTLEEVTNELKQVTIHFSQVNFDGPSGWKCALPSGDIVSVRMRDAAFRDRINKGYEEFSKTKPSLVKLLTVEKKKADGSITLSYYIEEMIRQLGK